MLVNLYGRNSNGRAHNNVAAGTFLLSFDFDADLFHHIKLSLTGYTGGDIGSHAISCYDFGFSFSQDGKKGGRK